MADRSWITVFIPTTLIFRYHLPLKLFYAEFWYFYESEYDQKLRMLMDPLFGLRIEVFKIELLCWNTINVCIFKIGRF